MSLNITKQLCLKIYIPTVIAEFLFISLMGLLYPFEELKSGVASIS